MTDIRRYSCFALLAVITIITVLFAINTAASASPAGKITVPVRPALTGTLPANVLLTSFEVVPAQITLSGPEDLLAQINSIMTTPVALTSRTESFEEVGTLILPEGVLPASAIGVVQIQIVISPKKMEKTLYSVPVTCTGTSLGWTILPSTVDLRILGPAQAVNSQIFIKSVSATINVPSLLPGIYVRRAVVSLPDDVILLGAMPEVFTIRLHSDQHVSPADRPDV